ncbi:MAG: hypothetical protein NT075_09595 [Chloroflexi bacterium]|nr:hypothetical protein [Chloroflexota bacterium]
MAKQVLTGPLEEQCEFLYTMAQEKIAQGNFTGATYALKEVVKHKPDYRDAATLLVEAKRQKSKQSVLLLSGFIGAVLFIATGTIVKVPNDLVFLLLAVLFTIVGFGVGNFIQNFRERVIL